MACRMDEGGTMLCFDVLTFDQNIRYGVPFEPSVFMSYYGQKATVQVNGSAQNTSYSDTLFLNVTLGQGQILGDFPEVTTDGLHITSNAEQLGVVAALPFDASGMPQRLGLIQDINITNISPSNDTVDLEVSGLLEGWTAIFLDNGVPVESVSILSNESKEIKLHIQTPTYKIEVQLSYSIPIEGADDLEGEYLYQKELLYENSYVEVFAFLLPDDDATSTDISLIFTEWRDNDQRMLFIFHGTNLSVSDMFSLTVSWENPLDLSWLALVIALLVVVGLIGFMLYKKRKRAGDEEVVSAEEAKPVEVASSPADLEDKKQTILRAIRRLKADYEGGNVPKEVYEDLLAKYKNSAIDIMKKIDGKG
jgi:hypothetical protein